MKRWAFPTPDAVSPDLQAEVGGHPFVAQALARRGYRTAEVARSFLDPEHYRPCPPEALPGLAQAAALLSEKLRAGKKILVWGDFDVDGQTSTACLVSALRSLGGDVRFHVPVRARESHGVSLPVLEQIIDREKLADGDTLLTCDTGISEVSAVKFAVKRGLAVVITDHHELPRALPPADAIVNPRFLPEDHALRSLSGVGAAYKVIEALCEAFNRPEWLDSILDLAALGLVADMAALRGEARYLVQRGLEQIRRAPRLGLKAIFEQAEVQAAEVTEEHLSFELAPRLNALGRLGDARLAVELLTTSDEGQARLLAVQLEGINQHRQLLTSQVFGGALAQLERDPDLLNQPILVLSHPGWPAGVLGIVASRLVERFRKPVILLSTPEGQPGRGSARSVPGVNITQAIAAQAGLLSSYGGHPMAAGLSLDVQNLPEFKKSIARTIRAMEPPEEAPLEIDGIMPLAELSLDLAADFERLAPFGQGNPPLVLVDRGLRIVNSAVIGRHDEHLLLALEDRSGVAHRAVWWQGAGWPLPEGWFDLAYQARTSNFRGYRELQIEWVDYTPAEEPHGAVEAGRAPEVIDYRAEPDPLAVLSRLAVDPQVQVWAEGAPPPGAGRGWDVRSRYDLQPAESLAIWNIPPGPAELRQALSAVKPVKVYLFAADAGYESRAEFIRRLAGLVKYAIREKGGRISDAQLVAAMAGQDTAVRKGLDLLAAQGMIRVNREDEGVLRIIEGGAADRARAESLGLELDRLLEEARAYRAYYRRANPNSLVVYSV